MPMTKVTNEDWTLANVRWNESRPKDEDTGKSFMQFLGITSFYGGVGYPTPIGLHMEEGAARKVKMLAGPNYHTILKAYEAVKECQK